MAQQYAKDQPAGFKNFLENIAIIGAGGSVGEYIAKELLATGKHTVTALTRKTSKSKLPEGVKVATVDYDDETSMIDALKGQQVLIISLSVTAPPDTQSKIIQAAAKAGVKYVMPNGWGGDYTDEKYAREYMAGMGVRKGVEEINAAGLSSIVLVCSFWYEFSLVTGKEWFGFDFKEKTVTFYDEGNTKINVSTWDQCGRAVAALFSFKELPEDENDKSPTVSNWRNKPVYIASFLVSQKDMFESWKRVSGDTDADWKIEYEPVEARYKRGLELMQSGMRTGFAMAMYARAFFPSGEAAHELVHGTSNDVLGLPKEDLDTCTKHADEMMKSGYSYMTREQ